MELPTATGSVRKLFSRRERVTFMKLKTTEINIEESRFKKTFTQEHYDLPGFTEDENTDSLCRTRKIYAEWKKAQTLKPKYREFEQRGDIFSELCINLPTVSIESKNTCLSLKRFLRQRELSHIVKS